MKTTILAVLILCSLALSQDAPSKKQLKPFVSPPLPAGALLPKPTPEQMKEAYGLIVKRILATSKYPPSTVISPIEKSWFIVLKKPDSVDTVVAYVVFDGQNGFGAMTRSTANCFVKAGAVIYCGVENHDSEALDMIPTFAVRGPAPAPASAKKGN